MLFDLTRVGPSFGIIVIIGPISLISPIQFHSKSCFPLLSSAYLAPVQWYAKLFRSDGCWMEQHDHFIKQTYRNRCIIATANGAQALTIPIERPSGEQASRMAMKDIRISDHGNWRHIHW